MHFDAVFAEKDMILDGIMLTIGLSAGAIVLGLALATLLAAFRSLFGAWAGYIVDAYVELMRNTPFLVQLFMIFFGLPLIGIRMSGTEAALLAMTLNLGAYSTEIIRAGVDSIHKSQIEAGMSLAMTKRQVFQYVVLQPAFARVWPALSSQFVLMLLASSICSFISVSELSGTAAIIEQRTFRSFETYIVVTVIYLVLALSLKLFLNWLGKRIFPQVSGLARVTDLKAGGRLMQTFGWPEAMFIFRAAGWTILLTVIAFVIGGIAGGALAIMRLSRIALLRRFAAGYILIVQSIPVLMILFMSYYGLSIIGIELPPFFAASASLAVYVAAYLAEIWRGSIESVPRQQWEASASLAHTPAQQYRYVILPQAVRISLPPTVGFLVQLVKNTSIVSVVGFVELSRAGQLVNNATFQPFQIFTLVAAIYFAICFPLSRLSRHLEKVMNASRPH